MTDDIYWASNSYISWKSMFCGMTIVSATENYGDKIKDLIFQYDEVCNQMFKEAVWREFDKTIEYLNKLDDIAFGLERVIIGVMTEHPMQNVHFTFRARYPAYQQELLEINMFSRRNEESPIKPYFQQYVSQLQRWMKSFFELSCLEEYFKARCTFKMFIIECKLRWHLMENN
jgi:hypothetical protein